MGLGASNLSKSYLNTLQSSVTRVGQNLSSEAKNSSEQDIRIQQVINFQNGPPISPCKDYILQQTLCDSNCDAENRPPIYQCQFSKTNTNLPEYSTNNKNCDDVFGQTYQEAISYEDGICTGENTSVTETQRRNICTNRVLRLMCPNNNTLIERTNKTCSSNSDCVSGGNCNQGICWEPSGFTGFYDNTCGSGCGRTVYIHRVTRNDNGANMYDYGFAGDLIDSSSLPDCIGITGEPGVPCKIAVDGNEFFECVQSDQGGYLTVNGISLNKCKEDCANNYKCPDSIASRPPTMPEISCDGGLCIGNVASVRMDSEQMAKSYIDSQMTTNITNDFTSEVEKTISQTNEGLNFQQMNTSDEFTEITQTIKNIITNTISNQSENVSTQYSQSGQTINFLNQGRIRATTSSCNSMDFTECNDLEDEDLRKQCQERIINEYDPNCIQTERGDEGVGCGCNITNETVQELSNNQVADNMLKNVMDSTVMNKLLSDYTLEVDQLNKGIDPFLIFLIIVIIIGIIAIVATYFIFKSLRLLLVVIIILAVIGVVVYFAVIKPQMDARKSENKTIPPAISLEESTEIPSSEPIPT